MPLPQPMLSFTQVIGSTLDVAGVGLNRTGTQSSWAANLVFAVQQAIGTPITTLENDGLAEELSLSPSAGFIHETLNFTITANLGFNANEVTFSNSYDAPTGPIANSVNPPGTIINLETANCRF